MLSHLKRFILFSDVGGKDFETSVDRKSPEVVRKESELLMSNAIPISESNDRAISLKPDCPQFPVNGSASRVNKLYEELILAQNQEYFIPHEAQETELVEKRLAEGIDEQLSRLDKETILEAAQALLSWCFSASSAIHERTTKSGNAQGTVFD